MDLECHIEAYPPPAIRWYDGEGRLIRNNQHFRISHFTFDDEYVNTILRYVASFYFTTIKNLCLIHQVNVQLF